MNRFSKTGRSISQNVNHLLSTLLKISRSLKTLKYAFLGKLFLYIIITCIEIILVDHVSFVKTSEALPDCTYTSCDLLSIPKRTSLIEVAKCNFAGMILKTVLDQVVPSNDNHGSGGKKYNRHYLQNNHHSIQSLGFVNLTSICPKLKSKPKVSATFKLVLSGFANNTWHPPSDIG